MNTAGTDTSGARRAAPEGRYYWRCTQFLLPNYSIIGGGNLADLLQGFEVEDANLGGIAVGHKSQSQALDQRDSVIPLEAGDFANHCAGIGVHHQHFGSGRAGAPGIDVILDRGGRARRELRIERHDADALRLGGGVAFHVAVIIKMILRQICKSCDCKVNPTDSLLIQSVARDLHRNRTCMSLLQCCK